MSEYFPKPNYSEANVKVELDWSNYATKTDFKNVTGDDTAFFAKMVNLANLKSDVDKLIPLPVDLSKLSDVVKNDVAKKDLHKAKIKNIED